MDKHKLLLIDGHSILSRAFYGVPILNNKDGVPTNAVFGFLNILFKEIDQEEALPHFSAYDVFCVQRNKKGDAGRIKTAGSHDTGNALRHACSDTYERRI